MIKRRLYTAACALLAMLCLFGCAVQSAPGAAATEPVAANAPTTVNEPTAVIEPEAGAKLAETSMVDERFELLSLIFRLAEQPEYSELSTDYQKALSSEFGKCKGHAAVRYAAELPLGYDAVFKFAVHIEKDENAFKFIDNIDSLVEDGRWTRASATKFLELVNAFYAESGFAQFFLANMDFFRAETQRFIDGVYADIDLDWFSTYVDPANLHCICSPASTMNNYGATANDTIIYCAVSGEGSSVVHEYCHSFANPIAHEWYANDPEFRRMCDDTIDLEKLPSYGTGEVIAGEYVTRAYNTLYYAEHGYSLYSLLGNENAKGFPYIEQVYGMITPYERPAADAFIESVLGTKYEMGEEQLFTIGDRVLRYRFLTLAEPSPYSFVMSEVGNVFGSDTGDVLYVKDTNDEHPYLLVDLGETEFRGESGYRMYSRISLD